MSRISYENNMMVIIYEGTGRYSHYYSEPSNCTADTENTISSIVQKYIKEINESEKDEYLK